MAASRWLSTSKAHRKSCRQFTNGKMQFRILQIKNKKIKSFRKYLPIRISIGISSWEICDKITRWNTFHYWVARAEDSVENVKWIQFRSPIDDLFFSVLLFGLIALKRQLKSFNKSSTAKKTFKWKKKKFSEFEISAKKSFCRRCNKVLHRLNSLTCLNMIHTPFPMKPQQWINVRTTTQSIGVEDNERHWMHNIKSFISSRSWASENSTFFFFCCLLRRMRQSNGGFETDFDWKRTNKMQISFTRIFNWFLYYFV